MELASFDVRAVYELHYDEQIDELRKAVQEGS
jgi:hypothetical protein